MTDAVPENGSQPLLPTIERFDVDRHDRESFTCGKPSLDSYLRDSAESDERNRAATVFVMIAPGDSAPLRYILGYYTLSAFAFQRDQGRRKDRDRALPSYRIVPALLIGRFALDHAFHGRGLGSTLLLAVFAKAAQLSGEIGISVVVVHALDDDAARFYLHQGFTAFKDEPRHLYIPMATIETLVAIG